MTEVYLLQMVQKPSDKKRYRYLYEVVKDGKVITAKYSNRIYVACFVVRLSLPGCDDLYTPAIFFSRINLIGSGISSRIQPYAVAVVDSHQKQMEIESVLKVMFESERFRFIVSDRITKIFI